MSELLAEQERMVGSEATDHGLGQEVAFTSQPSSCSLSQDVAVGLAANEGVQDGTSGDAAHICHHGCELDSGILEHRLQSVGESRPLIDEMDAVAREVAQLPLGGGWDEAPAYQPVAQQVGQPFGILDVGLTPGHGFGMIGVDDEELDL